MRDRLDPLIAERAPWLFSSGPGVGIARAALDRILGYNRTVELATEMKDWGASAVMERMSRLLCRDIEASGLDRIPRHGPALIVANHPTGIADGIVLWHLVGRLRPDLFFYANADILRVMPQMESLIAPVEWRPETRSHAHMRETMAYTRKAFGAGRLGVIFPSGRLAKRRGLQLHERPWMASAATIARKFEAPVIPMKINARNSALFYLFDLLHPTLRDITLFHETLNKSRQPFRVSVGEPISPGALPAASDAGIAMLRRATLGLGGRDTASVSLVTNSRLPVWARAALAGS